MLFSFAAERKLCTDSILGPLACEACPLISHEGGGGGGAVSTRPTDSFHVKNKYAHETVALVGLPSNLRKPTSHLPGKPELTKANKIF